MRFVQNSLHCVTTYSTTHVKNYLTTITGFVVEEVLLFRGGFKVIFLTISTKSFKGYYSKILHYFYI